MTNLTLVEVRPGVRFPTDWLMKTLGNRPKWAIRFAELYKLDARQRGALLRMTCPDVDVVLALVNEGGDHSGHLQEYVVELGYEDRIALVAPAQPVQDDDLPEGEVLVELFKQVEVAVAESVDDIVMEIGDVLGAMPGKDGRMEIKAQLKVSRQTGKLGINQAQVVHGRHLPNLGVLDVSGSMGESTIRRIVDEFVAMCVKADAWLAVVSDDTFFWEPGTYTSDDVLAVAQFGGTHYETLASLFEQDWGVVVTLADWDSSWSAKEALKDCKGRIGTLLDISLVSRPTFLAECLGQLADEVRPLMVAKHSLTYQF